MDNEADLSQITRMAKMYDNSVLSQSLASMKTASLDIGAKLGFGIGDIAGGRHTLVTGVGKRMRATLPLAKLGDQYHMERMFSITAIVDFLREETNIKVLSTVKRIEWKETFGDWYKNNLEKAVSVGVSEIDVETEARKKIAKQLSFWANDKSGYGNKFIVNLRTIWLDYLKKRYPLTVEKLGASKLNSENIIKEARKMYKLAPFQKRGLARCERIFKEYSINDVTKRGNKIRLKAVYDYFRKAEMLNYPFVFGNHITTKRTIYVPEDYSNPVQDIPYTGKMNPQNIAYLHNYLFNGGFLYLDDYANPTRTQVSGRHFENRTKADQIECRNIIYRATKNKTAQKEKVILKKTFRKLSKNDQNITGFKLGENYPSPFHPYTYFPFSVPRTSTITLKVFNRIGSLVRTITLKDVMPGEYSGRTGTLQAMKWDSKDNSGQPVESGTYFAQMSSGLFQKTKQIEMSSLRMLDPRTHPVFTSYYTFTGVPVCHNTQMERGSEAERLYGTSVFGWRYGGHTAVVYTEWAGILMALRGTGIRNQKAKQFFTNVLVYAIGEPGSVANRK